MGTLNLLLQAFAALALGLHLTAAGPFPAQSCNTLQGRFITPNALEFGLFLFER